VTIENTGQSEATLQEQRLQQRTVAQYDATAMSYMAWVLMPPLAGWALFSLFFKGAYHPMPHVGYTCCW
jgi:hypothetical protein